MLYPSELTDDRVSLILDFQLYKNEILKVISAWDLKNDFALLFLAI